MLSHTTALADVAQRVALQGWVQHCRHLGSFLFIVLRDGAGTVQLVVDEADKDRFLKASSLSLESVISIEGTVRARPATMKNPDMETGEVEVLVEQLCADLSAWLSAVSHASS